MLERSKARDWIATSALGLLAWTLVWSAGVVFDGPKAAFESADRVYSNEYLPLNQELKAGLSIAHKFPAVARRAFARMDSADVLLPDSVALITESAERSLGAQSYRSWRSAGEDSVAMAALRVYSLGHPERELLGTIERTLGAERRLWKALTTLTEARPGDPASRAIADSAGEALDGLRLARMSLKNVLDEFEKAYDLRFVRAQAIEGRYKAAVSAAKWRFRTAAFLFPLSLWGLLALVRFARNGTWTLPSWTIGKRMSRVSVSEDGSAT